MEEKEFNHLNMIPLIDVMLVLLVIVLTTSTFIARGSIHVELPKASSKNSEKTDPQVIEIDKRGNIQFNSRPSNIYDLKDAIRPLGKDTPVLIRADKDLTLQTFVDVLDLVKAQGFRRVSLQTEAAR